MKKRLTLLFGIVAFLISSPAFAQLGSAGQILQASKEDANTLMKAYFEPLGKGFGNDLNTGWFSTAKTHKTLGFDVSINASIALVPGSDKSFNVKDLPLKKLEYVKDQSTTPVTPTAFGADKSNTTVGAYEDFDPLSPGKELLYKIDMPKGAGHPYVPAPMIQASVGIIKSTDVTLRLIPSIGLPSDVKVGLFGVGVKHEINQWLPGGKYLPVDLSVQLGYTKLNSSIGFRVDPEQDPDVENNYPSSTWDGQKAEFKSSAFTANALVGKTFPIISFYGGLGYETSKTTMGTPGSYPVTVPNEDYPSNSTKAKKIKKVDDPIDIAYDDNSSLRVLVGTRIKVAIFNITASYTLSQYPVAQVGFGFGIR